MSSWAKPGVKCVCIKQVRVNYAYDLKATFAQVGETYTVREVGVFGGVVGITLQEIVNPIGDRSKGFGGETGFPAHYFRPLITRDQDIAMFKALCPGLPVVPPAVVPARVLAPTRSGLTEPACTGKFDG